MEPTKVIYELARRYLADYADTLGPSLTTKALGYLRSRHLEGLTGISGEYDPAFHDHNTLKALLQIEALFKKCKHFSSEECAKVARAGFLESEEICKATNARLDNHYNFTSGPNAWLVEKCEEVRKIISRTLGPIEPFHAQLPELVRITNGATVAHPRSRSGGAARLRRSMYATLGSHVYLKSLAKFWGYTINFRKIHHNRVELVPKNWKTHRTIACEPEGNIALQLAFDTYCKRQLKSRLNIDLSDQTRNQRLAEEASVHGNLCTVDLTAASDRLALNVVHLLFPREWVDFFVATRSPCWKNDVGDLIPYAKLSSMGNGYTFTIETLVFAAVCKSLGSKEYSVYGDDIIVETELFGALVDLLSYLGFEINQEKSHVNTNTCSEIEQSDLCVLPTMGRDPVSGSIWDLAERLRETEGDLAWSSTLSSTESQLSQRERLRRDLVGWLSNVIEGSLYSAGQPHDNRGASGVPRSRNEGVYRESCGVHYCGGTLVTPLFIRQLFSRRDWVLLVNNITSFAPPGGSCWEFAVELVRLLKLPMGPPVLDTSSCVFISVDACYRRGLIRTPIAGDRHCGPWQPVYKGLVERSMDKGCFDSRALFLWFVNRKFQPYESSRHTLGTCKCRLKWVRYRPVMADIMGGTVRLYWWTEMLLAGDGR